MAVPYRRELIATYNIVNRIFISATATTRPASVGLDSLDRQMLIREFVLGRVHGAASTTGLLASVKAREEQDFLVFPNDLFSFMLTVTLLQFLHGSHETLAVSKRRNTEFLRKQREGHEVNRQERKEESNYIHAYV